jgi:hypothetical protein
LKYNDTLDTGDLEAKRSRLAQLLSEIHNIDAQLIKPPREDQSHRDYQIWRSRAMFAKNIREDTYRALKQEVKKLDRAYHEQSTVARYRTLIARLVERLYDGGENTMMRDDPDLREAYVIWAGMRQQLFGVEVPNGDTQVPLRLS